MLSSLGNAGIRLAGWSYLPDFAAKQLLGLYHRALVSRGITPPKLNTTEWVKAYRGCYSFCIISYLVYNLVEASRSTPPNFFEILGLGPSADDASIRSAYRAFAKRYHPDRAGPASEPMFMAVRDAYEALKDPVKRFAYERFGQDALQWHHCSEPRDYIWHGVMQSSGFYTVSLAILLLMSIFLKPSRVSFWRYMLLLCLLAGELYFVVGPRNYGIMSYVFPNRVAFQHVLFFHQIFVFMSVALTRVVPALFPVPLAQDDPARVKATVQLLDRLAAQADAEVGHMLHSHFQAAGICSAEAHCAASLQRGDRPLVEKEIKNTELLLEEMENILIERRVRSEPPLQPLWEAAVRQRREQAMVAAAALARASEEVEIDNPVEETEEDSRGSDSQPMGPSQRVASPNDPKDEADSVGGTRECTGDDDIGGVPSPQSSAATVIADDGVKQRTTSTRSFIRVKGRLDPQSVEDDGAAAS